MKKYLKILILTLSLCLSAVFVACDGCNPEQTEEPTDSIALVNKTLELDLYESKTLNVIYDGDEQLSWTSSSPDTVSVDENGKVTALKEGVADVTVSCAENVSDTCNVKVVKSGAIPSIEISEFDKNIEIANGETYTLSPKLSYKGVYYSDATFNYVVTSGSEYVSVDENGKISAIALGSAEIYVSATWHGAEGINMGDCVNVTVKKLSAFAFVPTDYEIFTVESIPDDPQNKTYANSANLVLEVVDGGKLVSIDDISLSVTEGADVIGLSGKTVTSKKAGTATVKYEYKDLSGEITVKVVKPVKQAKQNVYYVEKNTDILSVQANGASSVVNWKKNTAYSFNGLDGEITSVSEVKNSATLEVVSNAEGNVDLTTFSTTYNEENYYKWNVYNEDYGIAVNVCVADYIISSEEEFVGYMPAIKSGYTVLERDLDFSGWSGEPYANYNSGNNKKMGFTYARDVYPKGDAYGDKSIVIPSAYSRNVFSGTFDGLGHSVKKLRVWNGGMFLTLKDGTIKNFALIYPTIIGTNGFLVNQTSESGSAVIDNVYVKFNLNEGKSSEASKVGAIHTAQNSTVISNCVFDIEDGGATEESRNNFGLIAYSVNPIQMFAITNSYFVYNGDGTKIAPTATITFNSITAKKSGETATTTEEIADIRTKLSTALDEFFAVKNGDADYAGYYTPTKDEYLATFDAGAANATKETLENAVTRINTLTTYFKRLKTYSDKVFTTEESYKAALASKTDPLEGFNSNFWELQDGKLIFKTAD